MHFLIVKLALPKATSFEMVKKKEKLLNKAGIYEQWSTFHKFFIDLSEEWVEYVIKPLLKSFHSLFNGSDDWIYSHTQYLIQLFRKFRHIFFFLFLSLFGIEVLVALLFFVFLNCFFHSLHLHWNSQSLMLYLICILYT